MRRFVPWLSIGLAFAISASAQARHYGPDDKVSCTGDIQAPNSEWAPITELDSLGDKPEDFVGVPGAGGLCKARVYTVGPPGKQKMKVYRVWNRLTGKKWGRWWTFQEPSGREADYRNTHGLCPSTGATDKLDRMLVCWLKVGAEFAVGPGQSKACTASTIPQTPTNSVYMALGPGSYSMWVEGCTEYASPLKE